MYIKFGWGDNPGPDEMPYLVTHFNLSLESGQAKLANCVPATISMTLELKPEANPAQEFLSFAVDQHNTAGNKGAGKIAVFKEEGVGSSLQELTFKRSWIVDLDIGSSVHDEKFVVNVVIAATEVTVSGVKFVHNSRKTIIENG